MGLRPNPHRITPIPSPANRRGEVSSPADTGGKQVGFGIRPPEKRSEIVCILHCKVRQRSIAPIAAQESEHTHHQDHPQGMSASPEMTVVGNLFS